MIDEHTVQILTPELENHFNGQGVLQEIFNNTIQRENIPCPAGRGDPGDQCSEGSNVEQPFLSIINAINRRSVNSFFRDRATLVTIVLSNETTAPSSSSDNLQDYSPYTTENVLEGVKNAFTSSKPYVNYGIIVQDEGCFNKAKNNGDFGAWAYGDEFDWMVDLYHEPIADLVNQTNGISKSICEDDYTQILQEISASLKKKALCTD